VTGNLHDLQGRAEAAVAEIRPATVLDPAGTAILDNFLRAHYLRTLTTDDNDHTIE
jgi:Flp pilus assembly protein TadD